MCNFVCYFSPSTAAKEFANLRDSAVGFVQSWFCLRHLPLSRVLSVLGEVDGACGICGILAMERSYCNVQFCFSSAKLREESWAAATQEPKLSHAFPGESRDWKDRGSQDCWKPGRFRRC